MATVTDLDPNDTRDLARLLVSQLNPSLEGERAMEAARNLMRLAARMAGHVAADVADSGSGMAYGPDDDEGYVRYLSVKASAEALSEQASLTGEELADPGKCWACRAHGCDGECYTG